MSFHLRVSFFFLYVTLILALPLESQNTTCLQKRGIIPGDRDRISRIVNGWQVDIGFELNMDINSPLMNKIRSQAADWSSGRLKYPSGLPELGRYAPWTRWIALDKAYKEWFDHYQRNPAQGTRPFPRELVEKSRKWAERIDPKQLLKPKNEFIKDLRDPWERAYDAGKKYRLLQEGYKKEWYRKEFNKFWDDTIKRDPTGLLDSKTPNPHRRVTKVSANWKSPWAPGDFGPPGEGSWPRLPPPRPTSPTPGPITRWYRSFKDKLRRLKQMVMKGIGVDRVVRQLLPPEIAEPPAMNKALYKPRVVPEQPLKEPPFKPGGQKPPNPGKPPNSGKPPSPPGDAPKPPQPPQRPNVETDPFRNKMPAELARDLDEAVRKVRAGISVMEAFPELAGAEPALQAKALYSMQIPNDVIKKVVPPLPSNLMLSETVYDVRTVEGILLEDLGKMIGRGLSNNAKAGAPMIISFLIIGILDETHYKMGTCDCTTDNYIIKGDKKPHRCHRHHQCMTKGDRCGHRHNEPHKTVCNWSQRLEYQAVTGHGAFQEVLDEISHRGSQDGGKKWSDTTCKDKSYRRGRNCWKTRHWSKKQCKKRKKAEGWSKHQYKDCKHRAKADAKVCMRLVTLYRYRCNEVQKTPNEMRANRPDPSNTVNPVPTQTPTERRPDDPEYLRNATYSSEWVAYTASQAAFLSSVAAYGSSGTAGANTTTDVVVGDGPRTTVFEVRQ
ncbi:Hypothetical protein D9617_6g093900 [Elsinoe fawcettii]|nr:Hypothetical protein D9617_6g093900 [Elsinoe fawcettii]